MRRIPQDILDRFGNLADIRHRNGPEFSSACPQCGGGRGGRDPSDRFRIWERAGQASNFWCRRCGYQGFADDNKPGRQLTDTEALELSEIRQREASREEKRLQAKIEELRKIAYWEGWHDAMTDRQRQLWRDQGIADSLQDWFRLGHVEGRQFYCGDIPFTSAAMTIPHFEEGWAAVNVQYRIINPPTGVGKYRYTAGLPAPLFLTEPDTPIEGSTILVEGAKKAIIVWAHLGSKYKVIAFPSKMPGQQLVERLVNCDPAYLILDPDAYTATNRGIPAINRLVKLIGARARVVKLPVKPDDLLTMYGGTADDLLGFMRMAVQV